MNYDKVINDIEKLVGLRLNSIKPGAEIKILEVDREENRILIETSSGTKRTRFLGEIKKIWVQLCSKPAVHVDAVLGGSGSSRNQPETILANLPYIEWLRINNKKHIVFVGEATHDFGTLRQMDPIQAEQIRRRLQATGRVEKKLSTVIVVSTDIRKAAIELEMATGIKVEPLGPGIYKHDHNDERILLITSTSLDPAIKPGTYMVKESKVVPRDSLRVNIGEQSLHVICAGDMYLMVSKK